ncbi:MAG: hypothetical protein PHP74_04815, partial [Candidatus Gracilibacteria bacterium]|nr:hypothetical protein [Candidatus Gracilibacteria bacterium]
MLNSNKKSALNKNPSKIVSKGVMAFFTFVFVLNSFAGDILPVAKAEVPDTSGVYDQSGNLNIGKCMKQGGRDFIAFLHASLISDTFIESIVEPWNDVLFRNDCHSFDIYGLVMQQDKIRKQIRDAFLTCRNEKIPKLKEAYYKTTVEIAFARNVVTGFPKKQYKDMDILLAGMNGKYVDKWFTKEQFAIFGNELKVRYADRVSAYVDKCDQGSWAEVARKFEEFNDQVIKGGFVEDLKKGVLELERKAKDVEKSLESLGDAKGWEDLAKGLFQLNLSGTPCTMEDPSGCKDFWKDFTDEFDKNNPFTGTNFPTTTQGIFEM